MLDHLIYMLVIPLGLGLILKLIFLNNKKYSYLFCVSLMTFLTNFIAVIVNYILKRGFLSLKANFTSTFYLKYLILGVFVLVALSLVLFIFRQSTQKLYFKRGLLFFSLTFLVIVSFYLMWLESLMGNMNIAALLFNLQTPLETNNEGFARDVLPMMLLLFILIVALFLIFYTQKLFIPLKKSNRKNINLGVRFLLFVFSLMPLIGIGVVLNNTLNFKEAYNYFYETSDFIGRNYKFPHDVKITEPSKKRNLVLILVESLEPSFHSQDNGGFYQEELLPNLLEMEKEGYVFGYSEEAPGFVSLPGTTWSIAGIVSQTAGVPYKLIDGKGGNDEVEDFLPGIVNLGDLLEEAGYYQEFIVGSDSKFAGIGNYFKQHGNYRIHDYKTLKDEGFIPKDYHVWWGVEDQKIYDYARHRLDQMPEDRPFSFIIETSDTHFPNGFTDGSCSNKKGQPYANSLKCADQKIAEFYLWLKEQPYFEDTTVIILGDHLSMDKDFFNEMPTDYKRSVYNLFLNTQQHYEGIELGFYQKNATPFDMFPTTLASLGFEIEGESLGLGVNLFSAQKTLLESYNFDLVYEELMKRSPFYEEKFYFKEID